MLFEELSKANMQALKDHDKLARTILSIVYGKCKQYGIDKYQNPKEVPDSDCLNIIRKTIKELDEEALAFKNAGRIEQYEELVAQKAIIEKFLPQMMNEDKIREIISLLEDKSIPFVMKHFKANYNGLVDMGLVNKIAKEF